MKRKIILIFILNFLFIFNINICFAATNYNDDNLVLGAFFTANYPEGQNTEVDEAISLYTSSNGTELDYIGEAGLIGRDPRIYYHNGVYYLAATKGGSKKGGFTARIYKSTDLINWTDDSDYPFAYRYDIDIVPGNKYGLNTNTWGPKWIVDGNNVYLMVTATRFDANGSKYYYYYNKSEWSSKDKARSDLVSFMGKDESGKDVYDKYSSYFTDSLLDNTKSVLFLESPVFKVENGKKYAQYVGSSSGDLYYTRDDSNNLYNDKGNKLTLKGDGIYYDKDNSCMIDLKKDNDNYVCGGKYGTIVLKVKREPYLYNNNIVQAKCPFYTNNTYPLFDGYIAKITGYGTSSEEKDINYQNLSFGSFQKIKLNGFEKTDGSTIKPNTDPDYYLYTIKHSVLVEEIIVSKDSKDSSKKKYAFFLKTDPWGVTQRWLSNNIIGPYKQIDDTYYGNSSDNDQYKSKDIGVSSTATACRKLIKNYHEHKIGSDYPTAFNNSNNLVFQDHFEGSDIQDYKVNNSTRYIMYTDHYRGETESGSQHKYHGIYYSIIDADKDTAITDSYNHLKYNTFAKLKINHTEKKPKSIQINVIRNGGIYRPSSSNLSKFKLDVENASNFHLNYKVYNTNNKNKVFVVIKGNRPILKETSIHKFTRIEDSLFDKTTNNSILKKQNDFKDSNYLLYNFFDRFKRDSRESYDLPYSYETLYFYKIVDRSEIGNYFNVTMVDKKENDVSNSVTINIDVSDKSTALEPLCPVLVGVSSKYDGTKKYIKFYKNYKKNGDNNLELEIKNNTNNILGGTLEYSVSQNGEWTSVMPGRISPGLTNVYVRVRNNNKVKDCGYASIKITANDKTLTIPKSPADKVFNAKEQSSGITCPSGSKTTGVSKATNIGAYTQICTLNDTTYSKWSDGSTTPKSIVWKIIVAKFPDVTISGIKDKQYTGKSITQNITVKKNIGGNTITLVENVDYEVSYSNNINVGTATISITGKGNYSGGVVSTFKITITTLNIPESPKDKTYDGSSQLSGITCPVGSSTSGTTNATNAGTYTQICTISDNSFKWKDGTTGTKKITWKILPIDISKATVSGIVNKQYTGSEITQNPIVKYNLNNSVKTLVNDNDYTISYKNNINEGNASMIIKGKGNYNGTKTVTFIISKLDIKILNYREHGNNISRIGEKTDIKSYRTHFNSNDNIVIKVYDNNSKEISDSKYICTGYKTKIYLNDKLKREYINSVLGDVNGDGCISPLDYVKIKNHIMEENIISKESNALAADYNNDEKISPLDYIEIKNYIMKGAK